MKPILFAAACGLSLSACISTSPDQPEAASAVPESVSVPAAAPVTVGAFTAGTALSVDDALARSASLDGQTIRVAGTIRQVCQARGCWLTFSTGQGRTLRVMTHGEGEDESEDLLFPKDAAGRHAEVIGTLRVAEESVERRRHLAEDGGATPEQIAAITEPTRSVSLVATGARID